MTSLVKSYTLGLDHDQVGECAISDGMKHHFLAEGTVVPQQQIDLLQSLCSALLAIQSCGSMIVGRSRRMICANEIMAKQLRSKVNGKIEFVDAQLDRIFRDGYQDVEESCSTVYRKYSSACEPVHDQLMTFRRLAAVSYEDWQFVLVSISAVEERNIFSPELIKCLHPYLTGSEAKVVALACSGLSDSEIAVKRQSAVLTVRNQRQSAKAKIGVSSEAELRRSLLKHLPQLL